MAKPTRHRGKWRIRWTDHTGERQSEVYESHEDADIALHRHQLEVADAKRGHRSPITVGKLFEELRDYWLTTRASQKRSEWEDLGPSHRPQDRCIEVIDFHQPCDRAAGVQAELSGPSGAKSGVAILPRIGLAWVTAFARMVVYTPLRIGVRSSYS